MADSTTNLDLISVSQSSKERTDNALSDAASVATYFGRRASTTTGLTWGYYGAVIPGSATRIANNTLVLTANATNYLYATAAGVVTKVTSAPAGWPNALAASAIPLYEIITGPATATSYQDWRPGFAGSGIGSPVAVFVGDDGGSPNSSVTGTVPVANQGDAAASKFLKADGTWATPSGAATSDFVGDDGGSPNSGVHGLVPAPNQGDAAAGKFLKANGTWAVPAGSGSVFVGDNGGSPNSSVTGTVPVANQGDASAGKFLKADGVWVTPPDTDTTYSDFVGDNGGSPNSGVHGLVPAPNQGDATKFLRGDGAWEVATVTPPTGTGFAHVTSGAYDGAAKTNTETTALLDAFVGDVGSPGGGVKGLVPAPAAGDSLAGKFLKADGGWSAPPGSGSSALNILTPAFSATLTVDLTSYASYPFVVVEVTLTAGMLFNITNGVDAQVIRCRFKQGGGGGNIITYGANMRGSSDTPLPVLSISSGTTDRLGFEWHATDGKADLVAVNKGYT